MINSRMPSNLLVSRIATDIVQKQADLAKVQEQIASGKKVNRPSDSPAQAARILNMHEATSQLDQYQRNASTAESQLANEENILVGVSNNLNRIRELALGANSGIVEDSTREAINSEVRMRLDELYELANSKDSFGNYLFGGSNTQSAPFSRQVPVNYAGNDDSHELSIGLGRKIKTGDSGLDVFMRIRSGNGDFSVHADPGNTGTGIISQGSVTDPSLYNSTPYRLDFTSSTTFDIVNDDTGTVIQAGNTYGPASPIEFNGVKTSIGGSPSAGDSFRILPSRNQDLFTTLSNFSEALENSTNTSAERARMQQAVNETLINLDAGLEHINTTRARVGTRLNSIDTSRDENANMALQLERTLANIEDVDIAEAITDLQTQANTLEILQKSFSRIESLSLFNYM